MNLFWDGENKTIRGSFVNLILTGCILYLIMYGVLSGNNQIVQNIKELASFITWFFGISFVTWSTKKVAENIIAATGLTIKTNKEE